MSIQHFNSNTIKKTNWSGGTTSELFIHPAGSDFKSGAYLLRLSIATVEIEESTFTSLPDVNRTLMVLEGNLKLQHKGQHESNLGPLEFDNFKGGWHTKSWGKVTDFNLMTKGDCNGTLKGMKLSKGDSVSISFTRKSAFIHTYKGFATINDIDCDASESILIQNENSLQISAKADCTIVVVEFD